MIEVINDNMPFLVDSVMGELQDRGLTIHLVLHPIVNVPRDGEGLRSGPVGGGGGAGFSAAARLWSGSGAARASEAHLPLGSSLAVGVLRNTLGTSALLRTSELLPLLAADSDLQARPEPCDVAVWQLLARAAASGLRIDPVPFLVLDVHCSGSGGGRGDWDCNERGDGRSLCADVLPLRRFLARRIAAAGRDGNRPSSASAGWVPDALDLADVLLVLQAHT